MCTDEYVWNVGMPICRTCFVVIIEWDREIGGCRKTLAVDTSPVVRPSRRHKVFLCLRILESFLPCLHLLGDRTDGYDWLYGLAEPAIDGSCIGRVFLDESSLVVHVIHESLDGFLECLCRLSRDGCAMWRRVSGCRLCRSGVGGESRFL